MDTDNERLSFIRVHPCSSVVGSFWLRPAALRGHKTPRTQGERSLTPSPAAEAHGYHHDLALRGRTGIALAQKVRCALQWHNSRFSIFNLSVIRLYGGSLFCFNTASG